MMVDSESKEIKVTFHQKKSVECPICRFEHNKEELLTGRGRLIAGDLNQELRRSYQESQKYGKINPLIYPITVCPQCFFASFPDDFDIPTKQSKAHLEANTGERTSRIKEIFPRLDFDENRTIEHGAASYVLAATCYSFFEKKYAPSFKRAVASLRASWLFHDLLEETNNQSYGYIRNIFYKKSAYFYNQSLEASQSGAELLDTVKNFGPDTDNNFGYDGMIYLAGLLKFNSGMLDEDLEVRAENFIKSKRMVSKLFGLGKASKDKPTAILEKARELYDLIHDQLKEIEEKTGIKYD